MMRLFKFLDKDAPSAFEEEFRDAYQEPGVRLLEIGAWLIAFVFAVFYSLDVLGGYLGMTGGAQTARLAVVGTMLGGIALLRLYRRSVLRHYSAITLAFCLVLLQASAYVAFAARRDSHHLDAYWSITSTMETVIICVFGLSRLKATTTLVVSVTGIVAALMYATELPNSGQEFARLLTHLSAATLACFLLRATIESRERKLFLQGKRSVEQARYSNQLEIARIAAEKAEQQSKLFLANMSHEVRTPLNAILQIMEMVGRKAGGDDRELLGKGRASAQALLKVLNNVLDYTKLAAGAEVVRLDRFDLEVAVRTVSDLFSAAAEGKGLELIARAECEDGCRQLIGDEVKLVEIMSNLVSNAIAFTDEGQVRVKVRASRNGADPALCDVRIEVRDTGRGIQEGELERIFTAFYQGQAGSETGVGTGLGLAIVQHLVGLLAGRVSVTSTPGLGSLFVVQLSLAIDQSNGAPSVAYTRAKRYDAEDIATAPERIQSGPLEMRVLMAEDNALNAELAVMFLDSYGCSTVHVKNGRDAVEQYREAGGAFDVVLMDCSLPVLNGIEATAQIRVWEKAHGARRVPIVAVTAHTQESDRQRCLDAGMDDYLAKPYGRQELIQLLTRWGRGQRSIEVVRA